MRRAIIAHCWSGHPEYCWYPYAKRELEKRGFAVAVPAFPDSDAPNMKTWVPVLRAAVGKPDAETFLIGHSAGCITILRYLESFKSGETIGGAVFVAGFTDDLGYEELKDFFTTPINFSEIKKHCPKFVAIHSDNDPFVPLKHADVFKRELGAKVIVKHDVGHFSGDTDDTPQICTELPEVVTVVAKMSK